MHVTELVRRSSATLVRRRRRVRDVHFLVPTLKGRVNILHRLFLLSTPPPPRILGIRAVRRVSFGHRDNGRDFGRGATRFSNSHDIYTTALTGHRRRDRVVVLRAQRVVDFDLLRELLDGEAGQAAAAEFFRRRRVHLHVAGDRENLFADVQHAAGDVQIVVRDEIAAHLSGAPDALLQPGACGTIIQNS